MALFLKLKSGPESGKLVPLNDGLTIGRSSGADWVIDDPRMSGRHVQVKKQGFNFLLIDLGSKNGFRVNGVKSEKNALKSGTSLRIGATDFEVVEVEAPPPVERTALARPQSASNAPPLPVTMVQNTPVDEPPTQIRTTVGPISKPKRLSWIDYFMQFIQQSRDKVRSKPKQLRPFEKLVRLTVIDGIQTETVWTLGYGPRHVGPNSFDLVIEDPGAPPICFSLLPDANKVVFKTERPDLVKLNDQSVRTDTLKEGDVIRFASTSIRFGFCE